MVIPTDFSRKSADSGFNLLPAKEDMELMLKYHIYYEIIACVLFSVYLMARSCWNILGVGKAVATSGGSPCQPEANQRAPCALYILIHIEGVTNAKDMDADNGWYFEPDIRNFPHGRRGDCSGYRVAGRWDI